jgi:hypothetical protein
LTPDIRSLVAATAVAIFAIGFFGLAPALTATKIDVLPALKDEENASTTGGGRSRLQRLLVIAQVAVSLALLIVAGQFLTGSIGLGGQQLAIGRSGPRHRRQSSGTP